MNQQDVSRESVDFHAECDQVLSFPIHQITRDP